MKIITISFLLVLLPALLPAQNFEGLITKVKDGDTLEVLVGAEKIEVRLNGIDAPEKNQPFSVKSKLFLESLTLGKNLKFNGIGKDKYGRTLADVYLSDNRTANQELVAQGLAWHFKKYSDDPVLSNLEISARQKRVGLWTDKNVIPPWDYRDGIRPFPTPLRTVSPLNVFPTPAPKTGIQNVSSPVLNPSPSIQVPVIGNRKSRIYHPQSCSHLNNMSPKNAVSFPSAQAAEAAGYRHCR